ncbi:MAG: copper chaperone PCu(A)C [Paracoccaceae bacterium]|nr:copper chaperone PCu(A)C [Paracoccaceae bacterium]
MNLIKTFTAAAAGVLLSTAAWADHIDVSDAYFRASGAMAKAGAAFMNITNNTDQEIHLVGARSDIAKRVELHTHLMSDGLMKMVEIEGGIYIPPGMTHAMERGGDHVMFMGLTEVPAEGGMVMLTLIFEDGTEVMVHAPVGEAAAGGMANMGHSDHN